MKRLLAAGIPMTLLVSACGPVGDLVTGGSSGGAGEVASVKMAVDAPGSGYERLRTLTGYHEGNCEGPRPNKGKAAARADLRERAASEGADYVRIVGTGPLSERGRCSNDFYRVSGVAYASQAGEGDESAGTGADQPAGATDRDSEVDEGPSQDRSKRSDSTNGTSGDDKSPADKLADLEEMRERGLISESEYERLRRQILDEAF